MNFICQQLAIQELDKFARRDNHSILIEGPEGCGKSYLAKHFGNIKNIPDVQTIDPKVDAIRSAIETCYQLSNPIVLCIENLDLGLPAASYALLKFLEEPLSHVYIIVTCRNLLNVPDTIVSRCVSVTTAPPTLDDINQYASHKDSTKFVALSSQTIWKCIHNFKDIDTIFLMNISQLEYFSKLTSLLKFSDSVSNITWSLGHYPDNSETPIVLVLRYIYNITDSNYIKKQCVECLDSLSSSRISQHAVLAKFGFNCKYCE